MKSIAILAASLNLLSTPAGAANLVDCHSPQAELQIYEVADGYAYLFRSTAGSSQPFSSEGEIGRILVGGKPNQPSMLFENPKGARLTHFFGEFLFADGGRRSAIFTDLECALTPNNDVVGESTLSNHFKFDTSLHERYAQEDADKKCAPLHARRLKLLSYAEDKQGRITATGLFRCE